MSTESFRRQLRQESEKWWSEGLIDAALYEKLADRYQFNRLERDASNRFTAILLGLGGILLGLGAITFVAANWQEWPRAVRVVLLLSCFVGVNVAGFYLWRRPSDRRLHRLGHALLLLGALLLGANMALMSQMFHQSGDIYELFVVWGLGVLAMAYSLRLSSMGVLALSLLGMGYLFGWSSWYDSQNWAIAPVIMRHLPLVMSFGFLPLAYWCRSRGLFGLSAAMIAISLVSSLTPFSLFSPTVSASGWISLFAFVLPPALLWSHSDRLWNRRADQPDGFQPIARSLAIVFLSVLLYLLSFHWLWQEVSQAPSNYLDGRIWEQLLDPIVLSWFTALNWLRIGMQLKRGWRYQERAINSGTIALLLLTLSAILVCHAEFVKIPVLSVFLLNILLFLLALGLLRDGLALGSRRTFWGGMTLLVLGVISRMLEYDTELLFKSIVFALCGVGVIAAGLWFERNIRPHHTDRSLPHAPQE
jgi:uncharacterized membrane protein